MSGIPCPTAKRRSPLSWRCRIGHNIGLAALSSGTIRYRFYSRWGLSAGEVAKVILFCGMTVGLGLVTLGGAALIMRASLAEDITGLDRPLVIALGALCLALTAGYVALAAFVRRPIRIRRFELAMPPLQLAFGQVAIGPLNFACVAACLHQVLAARRRGLLSGGCDRLCARDRRGAHHPCAGRARRDRERGPFPAAAGAVHRRAPGVPRGLLPACRSRSARRPSR